MTDVGQNPETDASLAVSCQDEYDPESISVAEAAKRIDAAISAITESESVNLRAALGRILSDDIHAQHDVPGQANSAHGRLRHNFAGYTGERSKRTQASGKFLRRSAMVRQVVERELCADYDWRSFACWC